MSSPVIEVRRKWAWRWDWQVTVHPSAGRRIENLYDREIAKALGKKPPAVVKPKVYQNERTYYHTKRGARRAAKKFIKHGCGEWMPA